MSFFEKLNIFFKRAVGLRKLMSFFCKLYMFKHKFIFYFSFC